MYKAILNLNNKKIEGTLTFYTLKKIQEEVFKSFELELTITEIFEKISECDMRVISALLITSTCQDLNFDFNNSNLEEKFENIYKYISDLLKTCMPAKENKDNFENDFEDIPDFTNDSKDWEFDWMEYMWNTTLKRHDEFYNITPKRFFNQMEAYKKANNIKSETEVEEL